MSGTGGTVDGSSCGGDDVSDDGAYCPFFQHTVELLGRRWTGAILRVLMIGPHRFGEVRCCVPGLSDRLLSERLHELEAEGLVAHRVTDDGSIYALSSQGEAIRPVFDEIERYATNWAAGSCAPARPGRIRN